MNVFKCSCAIHLTFPLQPGDKKCNAGRRKTIKPKIIIINLNPRTLPSKWMIMCHNYFYLYFIKMCKGLSSKTEFVLFAVKLENISQDKMYTSLSVLLFIACVLRKDQIPFFSDLILWGQLFTFYDIAHHDLFIPCILYIKSNIKFWLRSCVCESSWRSNITFSQQTNILSKCIYCKV